MLTFEKLSGPFTDHTSLKLGGFKSEIIARGAALEGIFQPTEGCKTPEPNHIIEAKAMKLSQSGHRKPTSHSSLDHNNGRQCLSTPWNLPSNS